MSTLSFLSVYLSGAALILLLTAGSRAQYYDDSTASPDYDYNATFEYTFFSNASHDDLETFLKGSGGFVDQGAGAAEEEGEGEGDEGTPEPTATPAGDSRDYTESTGVDVSNAAASFPVCLDFRRLVWMLLISVSLQQTL